MPLNKSVYPNGLISKKHLISLILKKLNLKYSKFHEYRWFYHQFVLAVFLQYDPILLSNKQIERYLRYIFSLDNKSEVSKKKAIGRSSIKSVLTDLEEFQIIFKLNTTLFQHVRVNCSKFVQKSEKKT